MPARVHFKLDRLQIIYLPWDTEVGGVSGAVSLMSFKSRDRNRKAGTEIAEQGQKWQNRDRKGRAGTDRVEKRCFFDAVYLNIWTKKFGSSAA